MFFTRKAATGCSRSRTGATSPLCPCTFVAINLDLLWIPWAPVMGRRTQERAGTFPSWMPPAQWQVLQGQLGGAGCQATGEGKRGMRLACSIASQGQPCRNSDLHFKESAGKCWS